MLDPKVRGALQACACALPEWRELRVGARPPPSTLRAVQHFLGRWKVTCSARTPVRVLRMTREGLDLFLQQHPLAQVRVL